MDHHDRERWERIERLIDGALDVPPGERQAWLRRECEHDEALFSEVNELIEAGERPDDFLAASAAEHAAMLLAAPSVEGPPGSGAIPKQVGPYRLLREIGRGGMGTVHLAEREAHFRQRVALKLIRPGLQLDTHLVARFLEERQVLADLAHPGIARLLDGGVTEAGLPWFAMEYVEGEPIDRACDGRRLSVDARLELFCAVCDAVDYAHGRRVVHRDIKPTNILVSDAGDPKLLDFGIAKLLATENVGPDLTGPGLRFLTPDYASPEQLRGDPISPASDVYSLGVLLYELLTGRRPHRLRHLSPREAERAVLDRDSEPPSSAVSRTTGAEFGDQSDARSLSDRAHAR
ncbi:MAG TPA: serine/threonine-protein kinase, partial [Gemmatimonadaceae bacterium]